MAIQLTDAQVAAYFHRSYTAVDGLWFMKVEEATDIRTALEADVAVWRVMPKIQARKLKELTGRTTGIEALRACFTTKLAIEGYAFEERDLPDGRGFEVAVASCPWVDLLTRSNRQHLAGTIGEAICATEYGVWATEFGDGIACDLPDRLCQGCPQCVVRFRVVAEDG